MGKRDIPPGFMYERQAPGAWQADLAQLAPRSDMHPWLHLAWLSGDPWEPVQRWCVYEMVPLRIWWGLIQGHRQRGKKDDEILEWVILDALSGPDPREQGYFDESLGRFISDALVTRQEWNLFREFKAIPKLFWIIQGTNGGHKRHFSPLEQKYLRLAGLPQHPPIPGELPYAEYDQRVLIQLARRDRLHQAQRFISPLADERDQQYVEYRRQLVAMLEDQLRDVLEQQPLNLEGIPRSSAKEDDPTGHIEESIDRFIETGSMKPPNPEP